jgi:hypothetical protein
MPVPVMEEEAGNLSHVLSSGHWSTCHIAMCMAVFQSVVYVVSVTKVVVSVTKVVVSVACWCRQETLIVLGF